MRSNVIDDNADLVWCDNHKMWYVALVAGLVSKQMFATKKQAIEYYKEGWITWEI